MDEKVQKVLDYIEEHKEEYLELLLRFCRKKWPAWWWTS